MSNPEPKQVENVLAAINGVQRALKAGIPKDQKNTMQGYSFRGIDDIYNVLGPLLPDHGLVILPRMLSREETTFKNAKGNTSFHVVVKAEFRFRATSDGSTEIVEMYGEATDTSDKATNKAMSAAYKYAAIQTFCIPVRGEPDADADSPIVGSGELPKSPKPAPPAKPVISKPVFTSLADESVFGTVEAQPPTMPLGPVIREKNEIEKSPAELEDQAIMDRYLHSLEAGEKD